MAKAQNLKEPADENPEPLGGISVYESEWEDNWDDEITKEDVGASFCVFQTGTTNYAFPLDMVKEVVPGRFVTPVSHLPSHIQGMVNVRGDIYAVFDLLNFLDQTKSEQDHNYLIVLNHDDMSVAIGVPRVPDSMRIAEEEIKPLKNLTKEVKRPDFLGGVVNRDSAMIITLKIREIVESEEFSVPLSEAIS